MKFCYDYYDIDVPSDIEDLEERARLAFIAAEEKTRIYAIPAVWYIISDDGQTVRVGRKRCKTQWDEIEKKIGQ